MRKNMSTLAAAGLLLLAAWTAAGAQSDTRDTVARWVETQQLIAKETRDWQSGKQILEQRIALAGDEVASLEGKIAKLREQLGKTDGDRGNLSAENRRLREASDSLSSAIVELEAKTLRLVAMLPERLQERVAPMSRRIPQDPSGGDVGLSNRFATVLAVLQEVNKFNRDVSVVSERRELPGGASAEVDTLYIGLAQAYYVTPDGKAAGVGRPTPAGWEWTAADELAPRVRETIAIMQNEAVPAYVGLPVEIR